MADEMNGEIFDISLATSVDTSEIDKLGKVIDEYDNKNINIVLNPQWTKSAEKTINKFKDTAVTMNVKLDIPDDLKKTTSQLNRLATVMERLSQYSGKNGTVSVSPMTGGDVGQTAPSRSETKAIQIAKSNTQKLNTDVSELRKAISEFKNGYDSFYDQIDTFNSGTHYEKDDLSDIIKDYEEAARLYINAYDKIKTFDPKTFHDNSITEDKDLMAVIKNTGIYNYKLEKIPDDVRGMISGYIDEAIESINDGINKGIYTSNRNISKEDFSVNLTPPKSLITSNDINNKTVIPLSQTVPIDMSALAGAMSLSFDDKNISDIKTAVAHIDTNVSEIYKMFVGGIPISGTSQSDPNKKPESINLDASNLIKALGDLKSSIDAKEAIIEKDANNKRIIQDNSKAQVTVDQLNAAIADSESKLNTEAARNKTIYNSIYKRMQTLVDGLKAENKEIYDNLGKNFLDVSDEQLDSFIKKLESLQENYKINIDVDIPNLDNFKAMYLTLDKAEKLEKASKKDTTKKSKTKAVTPSVAKKEGSVTAPVAAEVKLPENLDLLDKNSKKALDDIKTAVESIDGKIKESSETDKSKSKPKAKTTKEPEQADSKSLLTSALSDVIGDIRTTNSSIDDNVKQASASADLIFEDVDETKQDIKETKAIINGIYNKISNGIQVTNNGSGNTPTPTTPPSNVPSGGGNPKPKNPAPQNPTPLPTRTREDIDELARLELGDLNSQIQDLQFLLKQTGGIADSVFSQSDLDDVLTKLTDAKSKLDNIVDVASKKNVSPKALVTIDNELTNIQNALSDLNTLNPNAYNILSLAENYHNAFDIGSDELNANEILEPLKEMRDLLASAHIDTSSYDNAISEIEGRVERLKNTVESWTSIDLDASQFSSAYDAVEKISDELSDSLDGFKPLAQNAEDQIKQIFEFDDEIKELDKLEGKITSFYGLIQKTRRSGIDLNTIDIGNGKTLADTESLFQDYFNKKNSLNQYTQGQFSSEAEFAQYRAEIEANLIQPIQAYISNMNNAKIAIESVKTAEKDLTDEARKASQNLTLDKQISNKITELTQWREINSKAMTVPANKTEWQRYFDALKNGEINSTDALKKFNKEWSDFNRRVKEAGQNGKTTTSILAAMYKKFGGWTLVTRSITQAIRLMKDMVVQVKEVDTSMVNLRKVTDASEQSLEKYRKTAAKASINLGTSLTDQIDATSIFSRLGYELDEAEKLGEIASTYKSVAEDLDIDTASQSIISTLKAYQNLGVTADEIVDKFNFVGNNFAISSAGVGDALQRSASSLNAANNTLSESMAIITSANEIVQDPEKVGTSLKTISARIRGAKSELEEEGEEMTMTVSKLREEIKALSGVDIMIDDKTFKSTYDILNELSRVWKELNDTDQARIGEMLGGKVGINTVYAVLENFETARDVVKELDEGMAEGSAERELATALDSIQGKLNQLQSTWQSLSTNVIDSELVKDGLDWVVKFDGGLNDILGSLKNIKGIGAGLLTFGGMTALQAQLKNKTGSGRVRMFTLDEYARVSSGGNTERVDLIDKGALEKLPKLVQCTTSFMNLVREGWLKSHRIRSQAYLVGRFREYNGRTAKVVIGYSGQLRKRSKIIRSDSLLRWEKAIDTIWLL